jgi:WD40 repeat protein
VALQWHTALPVVTTASLDRAVRLWDARNGTLLLRLTGHTDILTNLDARRRPSEGANDDDHAASASSASVGSGSGSGSGSRAATDAIVTVSDDGTARVFHYNAHLLLQNQ